MFRGFDTKIFLLKPYRYLLYLILQIKLSYVYHISIILLAYNLKYASNFHQPLPIFM